MSNEKRTNRLTKAAVAIVVVLAVAVVFIFLMRNKGVEPYEKPAASTAAKAADEKAKPKDKTDKKEKGKAEKKNVVISLQIASTKKEYKLGDPIVIRATLHKNGGKTILLEMRELVNVFANASFKPADGGPARKLSAPMGGMISAKGASSAALKSTLQEEMREYAKLYPRPAVKLEPFPTKKHFQSFPEGKFAMKKELNLERMLMITKPGRLTLQLKYHNGITYYMKGRRRVVIDAWTGQTDSNLVSITIK